MANLVHGTACFLSLAHAIRYYQRQGYGTKREAAAAVAQKLASGEIKIGEPDVPNGSKLVLMDDGCRYGIEED